MLPMSRWLPSKQRLVTCALPKRMLLEASAKCDMRTKGEEDYSHLSFACPFAHVVQAETSRVDITSAEAFWGSLMGGAYRRGVAKGRCFAVL